MTRDVEVLERQEFDLAVVGGGIFGACTAWEAARRGLTVALIERGDFCGRTSAHSFKLIHGGIRYLQHADLKRVRQSSQSRRTFFQVAPHLTRPLPVVVPTYGHFMRGKEVLRTAMAMYDVLTWDRNLGVAEPSRRVPNGRTLSAGEVRSLYPGLPSGGMTGAGIFHDGQLLNPPRLVWAFVRTAMERGAAAVNYVEAVGLATRHGRVLGVEARDALGGGTFTVRAKAVVNAAGPYAEGFLRGAGINLRPPMPWSRDAYFVVARPLIPGDAALALPAFTRDADALLSRGPRHLFLVPWRSRTLVGVWHRVHEREIDDVSLEAGELESFLAEINAAYDGLALDLDDVAVLNSGLIPFGEGDPRAKDLKFAHSSRFVDHSRTDGLGGLLSLIGARYTTAPVDAADAVTWVAAAQDRRAAAPVGSDADALVGADFESLDSLRAEVRRRVPAAVRDVDVLALVQNHGSDYVSLLPYLNSPSLASSFGAQPVLRAEALHAVRAEMAQTLADVILRRTELGTGEYPGRAIIEECAALIAPELGWSESRRAHEVADVLSAYPSWIRSRTDERLEREHGENRLRQVGHP